MRRRGDAAHPPLVQGSGPAPMWIQGVGLGMLLGAWFLERDVLNASGDSKLLWSFPRQMSPSSEALSGSKALAAAAECSAENGLGDETKRPDGSSSSVIYLILSVIIEFPALVVQSLCDQLNKPTRSDMHTCWCARGLNLLTFFPYTVA